MSNKEEVAFEAPPVKLPFGFMTTNGIRLNNTKSCAYRNINNNINISNEHELKTQSGACVKYVHSKVTLYYNSCIELKWRRALHHCQSCDFGGEKGEGIPCGAIHYGLCTEVVDKLPAPRKLNTAASPAACHATESSSLVVSDNCRQPTSTPTSHLSTLAVQTIQNGSSNNDNSSKDIRSKDSEKENTDARNQNNNFTQITKSFDTNSNSTNEGQTKKGDISKQPNTVIQNTNIPTFYYPMGRPVEKDDTEEVLLQVSLEFSKLEEGKAFKTNMGVIVKTCGLPLYWKCPLFMACGGGKLGYITFQMFSSTWTRLKQTCYDTPSLFITLIAKPGTKYIEYEDLVPLIQDVVESHPGLMFLLEAPEFHSRYVNTVIARILYCVNRSWTGKITLPELRKSNFLRILQLLEEEDDINQILDYFSYEHFYVIYCKFWELDKDHDLFIDRNDLARHNDHAISSRMIDRIFSGAVTRGKTFQDGKMSYPEFVWFLLSEEDKKHPTSVEYWFRCMDLDGDGVISMYEMEYFYDEQMQKMETLGIERLPFEDCLCQMIDLVQPVELFKITLWDLKKCKMTDIFFDTFMNLDKFLEHEQRDPFANLKDLDAEVLEQTDWEKYAAAEYEILVAEEGTTEQEEIHYQDDFSLEEEDVHHNGLITKVTKTGLDYSESVPGFEKGIHNTGDDVYNFSKSAANV